MTTTVESIDVDIQVADTAPCAKRITLTVPAEAVNARLDAAFKTFAAGAQVPGFRKGKAPRALLEKKLGSSLGSETRQQLMSEAYQKAIDSKSLRPISEPMQVEGTAIPELERGKAFVFQVDIETLPDFEVKGTESLSVKRPIIEIKDEHINAELLRQCYRFGTPARIEGAFEHLDRMVGKAVVTVEGRDGVYFESENALCVVPAKEDEGKGALLGMIFEGLEAALLGKSIGATIEVSVIGADAHEREELRGKKITVTYTIKEAERITPQEVSKLAELFGLESEAMLREQVNDALEQRRDGEQRAAMREQVFEAILDATDFEMPQKLGEMQVARTLEQQRYNLLSRGVDPEAADRRVAEMQSGSSDAVRRRLKLFFIVGKLSEQFGVTVTEAELNGRIASLAQQQNVRPEVLRKDLEKNNRMGEVMHVIREAKVADRLLVNAKTEDVAADDWNTLVNEKAKAATTK
ncbi:MAG: trigger factor [Phycisphaerales bacterium]|nr:trigger factor [Phycisphaerales bacterium]